MVLATANSRRENVRFILLLRRNHANGPKAEVVVVLVVMMVIDGWRVDRTQLLAGAAAQEAKEGNSRRVETGDQRSATA